MNAIFEDTATAFALKSDSELERAFFIFKLISKEPLVKMGSVVTNFAIKAHLPVESLIRATVFDQFCGGVNEEDCMPIVDKMWTKGVCSILDYSVEGKDSEDPLDDALAKTLTLLDFVKEKEAIPFAVFKPSGYARFELLEKVSNQQALTKEENDEWERVIQRYDRTCKKAYDLGVSLLIDAEESWIQSAADNLAELMMQRYNQEKSVVFNTLQMYRHDRFEYLKNLQEKAKREGFRIGVKVVRGAYMEKENLRAETMGYTTPICASKIETNSNFDDTLIYILKNLDDISLYVGTHNEASCYALMNAMHSMGLQQNDSRIWFGQLYGMSDQISFNLAANGYNVTKYLPFGPVRDVIPYLIRRAEENTSVAGQTSRELELLRKERKRREI